MPAKVKTPVGDAPVVPVILLAAGLELCWFAIHYWGSDVRYPTDPVKAVLQGRPIPPSERTATPAQVAAVEAAATAAQNAQTAALAAESANAGGSGAAGIIATAGGSAGSLGAAIAADAQRYVGAGYSWGGNASRVGDWDCSSFVSYVLGHDLGLPLPGGGRWGAAGYPPNSHGPTTLNYALFGTGIERSQVQAGDLIVSTVHMGIAISPTTMISAESEYTGTGIGSFPDGFPGGPPFYRRVPGAAGSGTGTTQAAGTTTAGGRG